MNTDKANTQLHNKEGACRCGQQHFAFPLLSDMAWYLPLLSFFCRGLLWGVFYILPELLYDLLVDSRVHNSPDDFGPHQLPPHFLLLCCYWAVNKPCLLNADI